MEKLNNPERGLYSEIEETIKLAEEIEHEEDLEQVTKKLSVLLGKIEKDTGLKFGNESYLLYEKFRKRDCLVRVEQLSRVVKILETDQDIEIAPENESHYANAVIPLSEGIKIAFSEGQAPGPLRIAVAFGKTLIGFKTDRLNVQEIDFDPGDPRGADERKFLCRHVSGKISKEDLVGLVIRIPRKVFPKELLLDDEKDEDSSFIFRCLEIA